MKTFVVHPNLIKNLKQALTHSVSIRELLISAAALAVVSERKGMYTSAADIADHILKFENVESKEDELEQLKQEVVSLSEERDHYKGLLLNSKVKG
jgi:hypothetical protein